nr:unnamed protein product [Callosobruchus analis]
MKSRAAILEALESKASHDRVFKGRQAAPTNKGIVSTAVSKCLASNQNHAIQNCPAFQKLRQHCNRQREEFCNRLGIPVTNVRFAVSGINENVLIAKAKCNVDFRSRINNFCRSLTFYVLPTITDDPKSAEEEACEEHFAKTTKRNADGRFIVSNPFKNSLSKLGESRNVAEKRFHKLENRFATDLKFKESYVNFIKEYEALKHMSVVDNSHDDVVYYMPHHGVESNSNLSRIILHDFYVDDILTGCENFNEAVDICRNIAGVLKSGCFELRKWQSNSSELLSILSANNNQEHTLKFGERTYIAGVRSTASR